MLSAKPSSSRFMMAALVAAAVTAFGLQVCAQEAPAIHVGYQQITGVADDWSHHRTVFSHAGTEQDAMNRGRHEEWIKSTSDPRYVMQQLKRNSSAQGIFLGDVDLRLHLRNETRRPRDDRRDDRHHRHGEPGASTSTLEKDWSEDMGSTSANVGADNYPAKYGFDTTNPTTANCAGGASPDYVVYNAGVAGAAGSSAGQASIMAFDNLYATTCSGTVPQTYWAYNTVGTVVTSPVLSLDGSQVAFIQSPASGAAQLVVLKWAAGLTTSPSATCTGSTSNANLTCSTSLFTQAMVGAPISGSNINAGTYILSVTDATHAVMSANASSTSGRTDTVSATTSGTPITLAAVSNASYRNCTAPCMTTVSFSGGTSHTDTISSPYYDYNTDSIYVGDSQGSLQKFTGVFFGTPGLAGGNWPVSVGGTNVTSPVWDPNSGLVFVATSTPSLVSVTQDGATKVTSGSGKIGSAAITESPIVDPTAEQVYVFSAGTGASNNAVYQFPTGFTATSTPVTATFGTGGTRAIYAGAFDNNFYSTGTGSLYVCGNTGGAPTLYQIPISSGVMGGTSAVNAGPALAATGNGCSPVSEVYNNSGATPYDWIFVGVTGGGLQTACGGSGCIMDAPVTSWQAGTTYAQGRMVIDNNNFNIEVATTGGTSNATTQPTWLTTIGGTVTDGTVHWTNEGPFTFTGFANNHGYALNQVIVDSNGYLERVTACGSSSCTSQFTGTPTWSTTFGNTTTSTLIGNNYVTFTNQGKMGISAQAYTGGVSGSTIDNIGAATGASNIYFSTLSSQTCTTSGGTGGCAIQASQSNP